jgi:glucokinase
MFLGIEIGGTKLQMALGQGDGVLVASKRWTVDLQEQAEGIRRQILKSVPLLLGLAGVPKHELRGIAFGFGGPVDDARRSVVKSHQVTGWDDFPLADWAEQQFGVPAFLGNDADAAGLAEALFGAGKGLSPIFYVTVGSGIGGALIKDGEIFRGCGRGAGEIGHLWIIHDVHHQEAGAPATSWRPLELCSSGWAIAHAAGTENAEAVAAKARAGNPDALVIIEMARRRLALALTHVIALLCPRRIIIGGGVSLMGQSLFFQPLRNEVAAWAFKPFIDCYDIVPAALGEEVVLHGALALARRQAERQNARGA